MDNKHEANPANWKMKITAPSVICPHTYVFAMDVSHL